MSLPRKLTRWSLISFGGFATLMFVVVTVGVIWLSSSLPQTQGRIAAAGLQAPVTIARDKDGIPHIQAQSEHDAYFALGFTHAQDRLWQMEATRRIGAGRLAEILGSSLLGTDKFMRTLGLHRRAEAIYAKAPPDLRAALDAYAAGVNGYLAAHKGALPPEFYLLRLRPEPWQPADSLVWGQLMGLRLAGDWRGELTRAALSTHLTPAQVAALLDDKGDGPVSVEEPQSRGETQHGDARPIPTPLLDPAMLASLANLLPPWLGPTSASNSWVLSGQRTTSGKPLLANDPHLALEIPSTWYLAQVTAPGLNLSGATAPGVPIHIIGHNDRIAWGVTNTGSDVQDLFIETIDPNDGGRYLSPDGPQAFITRQETIAVRGADAVTITVRETRHGPVISDLSDARQPGIADNEVLAFASPGLRDDDRTAEALFRINRAGDWAQFTEALKGFYYPQQNLAYADVDGNIGFYVAGRVPIRKAGDGSLPVPGSTGAYDWTGFIPFEDLPHSFNPQSGRLINANNRVIGPDYRYPLGRSWEEPYRAERIAALIERRQRQDLDRMKRMQGDDVSLAARELLKLMLPMAQTMRAPTTMQNAALTLLTDWTDDTDVDMPQPLIFTAWLRELNRAIYGAELGPEFARVSWSLRPAFIADVLTTNTKWCDDITTPQVESCEFQVQAAFVSALEQLAASYGAVPQHWRWGDAHRVTFSHRVFSRVPVIGPWLNLSLATPGDDFTVNRGTSSIRDQAAPFAHVHGASMRAIYDLGDLKNSQFIIAGGQSGNPLSRDYLSMARRWRDVAYISIDRQDRDAHRLVLTPKESPR